MRRVEIVRRPTPATIDEIAGFTDRQSFTARHRDPTAGRPFSDHLWLDLQAGSEGSSVAVTIAENAEHDAEGDSPVIAVALLSNAHDGLMLETVLSSDIDGDDRDRVFVDVVDTALDTARDIARAGGGARVTWWFDDVPDAAIDVATGYGLSPTRELHEMRRPLPHSEHASIATRGFDPKHDAADWLRVNNRAFADHSEQGGWTVDTLRLRLADSWFDAEGFRIYEVDGELAGFCWTKIHEAVDEAPEHQLGEIYVIAVDPAFHGRGLGKQLTLAGLDWLTDQGIRQATLYVDAGNTAAVRLYERLGFQVHRTRHAFTGTLQA